MSWLRSRFESILDSILGYVVVMFVLPSVIAGIIYLATQRLEYLIYGVIVVLLLTNTVLLVYDLQRRRRTLKNRSSVAVFRDPADDTYYLVDIFGQAREFPDKDTFYYICDLFGLDPDVPEKSRREFKGVVAAQLPSRIRWMLPPHLKELSKATQLQGRLRHVLEVVRKDVIGVTEPQTIQIALENVGDEPLYIEKVTFYPRNVLSEHDFDKRHRKEDGKYVLLFANGGEKTTADVGCEATVDVYLAKKWSWDDLKVLEKRLVNAEFGSLYVHVRYQGETVSIYYPI